MAPTNQKNKSHKTRFASKGQRHKHKVAKETVTTGAPAAHRSGKASNVNRAQRLQQAKTLRDHRRADALSEKRTGGTTGGAPKLIALVSLSGSVNIDAVKKSLIEAAAGRASAKATLEHNDDASMEGVESEGGGLAGGVVKGLFGQVTFPLQRHKVRISLVEAPSDLLGCLDVVKIADIVAFVAPAEGAHIDEQGRELLTVLRALGLPATTAFIQGLEDVSLKRRGEAKKATVATLQGQLGEDLKVHAADTPEDFKQLLRHISELRLSPPVCRNHRPYVIAEKLAVQPSDLPSDVPQSSGGTLLVSGYLRARALRAGQLVHVAGLGDCQLAQIDNPEDPCPIGHHRNRNGGAMEVETEVGGARVLAVAGPNDFEPLVRENEPDPTAGEQTWPTEEELASAEEERRLRMAAKKHKKKVAKGTSEYQAAWIIDESEGEEEDDDVAADGEDQAMGEAAGTADASDVEDDVSDDEAGKGTASGRTSEVWPGEEGDAMDEDENMTVRQREEERRRLKELAQGDEEFPDEVDTPMDVPARQRFAKYRGLKSFRTSPWDSKESLPREYAQIFAFDNFRRTQKAVLKKQEQSDRESLVIPGMYVRLHLLITPAQRAQAEQLVSRAEAGISGLVTVMGLLQHETKMSVVHYSLKKSDSYTEPVKSKSELLFYTGLRTFKTRPIFSSDDLHMDKHKFERFLHPGRFSVATVFAPISFPPLPLLVFKEGVNGPELVATGAQREVDPDRVILKKIVISGYPYRVHKRKAVVRFMFFNPEDVRWFKPLELWTKYGRRGRIKEPVGTHGSMKCVFEGVVQQRDAVCATLYKRVYPRWPEGGTL